MITQGEAVRKLQGIIVGGPDDMSKAELILAVIDRPDQLKDVSEDKLTKYTALYDEYMAMDEPMNMTGDMAVEITEAAKTKFSAILSEIDGDDDLFNRMMEDVQEFLFNPPFEGLDDQPYGLVEIATFAYLEYFMWRVKGIDHESFSAKYRQSIIDRSYEANADIHMEKNYGALQDHFDTAIEKLNDSDTLETQMALCAILAISNVKTPEMVQLLIDGSIAQAREIVHENEEDLYVEGENTLADNANKLMTFVRTELAVIE